MVKGMVVDAFSFQVMGTPQVQLHLLVDGRWSATVGFPDNSKASYHLCGMPVFEVINYQKPLVGIMGKALQEVENPRLQRIREKLIPYNSQGLQMGVRPLLGVFDVLWQEAVA